MSDTHVVRQDEDHIKPIRMIGGGGYGIVYAVGAPKQSLMIDA
jgi:hypothetical protein